MPFAVLGAPRSGTNYFSALLKAHPALELQIEPFSLHTQCFKDEDLSAEGKSARSLEAKGVIGLVDDLAEWLNGDTGATRGFKETTLFAKLEALQSWAPDLKVIFIHRDSVDVAKSYRTHSLVSRWGLCKRFEHLPSRNATSVASLPRDLTDLKRSLWEKNKHLFHSVTIDYTELLETPEAALRRACAFLELDLHPLQEFAIRRRREVVGAKYPYRTFLGTQEPTLAAGAVASPHHAQILAREAPQLVTVGQALDFLNSSGVHPEVDHYMVCNPFNPELPLKYRAGRWFSASDPNLPATGFTLLGAILCCEFLGGRLPHMHELHDLADAQGWPSTQVPNGEGPMLAICESNAGPRPLLQSNWAADVFGNVAEWCTPKSLSSIQTDSFPVFGAGWNKDEGYLNRKTYHRWGRTGSVSVGFRLFT